MSCSCGSVGRPGPLGVQLASNPDHPIHSQDATDKGGKRSSVNLSVSLLVLETFSK